MTGLTSSSSSEWDWKPNCMNPSASPNSSPAAVVWPAPVTVSSAISVSNSEKMRHTNLNMTTAFIGSSVVRRAQDTVDGEP